MSLTQVPLAEFEGWPLREVYCGSSIGAVCRGMSGPEVAHFFTRGHLCVRAYVTATGAHEFQEV